MMTDVLVVGAGPTGLVIVLWLTALGVRVRIIDKTRAGDDLACARRAGTHAGALRSSRSPGDVTERGVVRRGEPVGSRTKAGRVAFGDVGMGLSPFPYALIVPQDEHERVLIAQLAARGVEVERGTTLIDFEDRGGHVAARLRRADGTEESCAAAFVAGCDGAHSTVREILGVGFPGGTYEHLFYVADVEASGAVMDGELHVALDDGDFLAVFPMKSARVPGSWHREIGHRAPARRTRLGRCQRRCLRPARHRRASPELVLDVSRPPPRGDRFVKGRAFLLGDAAHIQVPSAGRDEHRDRRCREPRVEVRRRVAAPSAARDP